MSYREKVAKARIFASSLCKLREFSDQEPRLSLDKRRAVIASIYLGGEAGCSPKNELVPALAQRSHLRTQTGLENAFSEKLTSPNPDLQDTIMKVSSLSAWAFSHSNFCENIMDTFVMDMVPEDMTESTISPVESVISALRSNWGGTKTFDLISLSKKHWLKKYSQR